MDIWINLDKVEKVHDDLEDAYSFLCRRLQDLEEINARIWLYIDMDGLQPEKKIMMDIIASMEKNIKYLDQLLKALEKVLQKYQKYEENISEQIDEAELSIDRWENVTYSDLGDIKSLLKNILS